MKVKKSQKWFSAIICMVLASATMLVNPFVANAATLLARPVIVGGSPAAISTRPWQVLIVVNSRTLCGGSIISNDWVLTAAHCFPNGQADSAFIFSGVTKQTELSNLNQHSSSQVIVHPQYNNTDFTNDLALVKLAQPIVPSANAHAIGLPVNQVATWPLIGTKVQNSGWGLTSETGSASEELLSAPMQVLTGAGEPCGIYGDMYNSTIQICAGNGAGTVDACQGDSGGPLDTVINGFPVLAGVTSVGYGCGIADYPGIYSRVSPFLEWIRQYVPVPTAVPTTPSGVKTLSGASGGVQVTWKLNPLIEGVTTYVATASPGGATCYSSQPTCIFQDIPMGKKYSISVVAMNAAGVSGASGASTVPAVNASAPVGGGVGVPQLAKILGLPATATIQAGPATVCVAKSGVLALKAKGVCSVTMRAGTKSKSIVIGLK